MDLSTSTRIVCLGQEFSDNNERREYFRQELRDHLADPAFRERPGFPLGTDDDIVGMSDPPFYTACPNPFLDRIVESMAMSYDSSVPYARSPLAVDVSVGKTDPLYKAHGYHTKVPHQAIVPSILHYTLPGDIVLDSFSGSGMTGIAAAFCGIAPELYKKEVEANLRASGRAPPEWGMRHGIVNDLSPAAGFIASNYLAPVDTAAFEAAASKMMWATQEKIGWMYETDVKGRKARIEYTVWSQVFGCPECGHEITFSEEAVDAESHAVKTSFACPACDARLTKRLLVRINENKLDPATGEVISVPRRVPVEIFYKDGKTKRSKKPVSSDLEIIARIESLQFPARMPTSVIPPMHMTHERAQMSAFGITHVHHFYLSRAAHALAALLGLAESEPDERIRRMLVFAVEQTVWGFSLLNRYVPTHFSQVNRFLNGVYYIPAQHAECSPWYNLDGKFHRLTKAFRSFRPERDAVAVTVGSASSLGLGDATIDYVFTDPPFGENIYYADLNFLVEEFHRVRTAAGVEAIVDRFKNKGLSWYQEAMQACFAEYFRVLKPGRWMTVVFSNSKASVWNSIQVALQQAGFVVAEVNALDKTQGSFRQVTSATAVKQDLVVSCYKPNGGLEDRFYESGLTGDTAWDFVATHLKQLVIVKQNKDGGLELIAERDPRRIFDRMVAWFVRHNTPVPISSVEFQAEVATRFIERDGMLFLPAQVDEYDRARMAAGSAPQRELFVHDERSAIEWLTDLLKEKPSTYQDVSPEFIKKIGAGWRKHEARPELGDVLENNFFRYDGDEPVPPQIHSYLSTNWKELRNLDKTDPTLVARARGRWYVPDSRRAQDVERKRERALLKEFERYKAHAGRRLREFRLEVMRSGFKAAFAARDYQTILAVADKVPEEAWQEDEQLLTFYDLASARLRASDGQRH